MHLISGGTTCDWLLVLTAAPYQHNLFWMVVGGPLQGSIVYRTVLTQINPSFVLRDMVFSFPHVTLILIGRCTGSYGFCFREEMYFIDISIICFFSFRLLLSWTSTVLVLYWFECDIPIASITTLWCPHLRRGGPCHN